MKCVYYNLQPMNWTAYFHEAYLNAQLDIRALALYAAWEKPYHQISPNEVDCYRSVYTTRR